VCSSDLLAEAAPIPFLEALEHQLEGGKACNLVNLFTEEGIFGSSRHTGVLWALESLSWSPQYLPRAAIALAQLARIDPGGTATNRPLNSLREIFLLWNPSTNARFAQRISVLDQVLDAVPDVGWRLLVALLPEHQGISFPTAKPIWRDFGVSEREELTAGLYNDGVRAVTSRFLARLGNNPSRWIALISALHRLYPEDRAAASALFEQFVNSGDTKAAEKAAVWEKLREFLEDHRVHQDAQWALPTEEVGQWQGLLDRITPADPVARHAWLFESHHPNVSGQRSDFGAIEREAKVERINAVREVLAVRRPEGVVELASRGSVPGIVGATIPDALEDGAERVYVVIDELIRLTKDAEEQRLKIFLAALCGRSAELFGRAWQDHLFAVGCSQAWPAETIARV